jgi:hypothetical protein
MLILGYHGDDHEKPLVISSSSPNHHWVTAEDKDSKNFKYAAHPGKNTDKYSFRNTDRNWNNSIDI